MDGVGHCSKQITRPRTNIYLSGPDDQATAITSLKHPGEDRWYGFATRTLIFWSVAAVMRHNVLSRLLVSLANRYLGIPMAGYFYDFAEIIRSTLWKDALDAFARFFPLMGFHPKKKKSEAGQSMAFVDLLGSSPCSSNGGRLLISRTEEKRAIWPSLLPSYLTEGRISHRCLGKLIGRLSSPQTSLFGKFPRTQLRPMYRKFRRMVYPARLSLYERTVPRWWKEAVADFTPRMAVHRPDRHRWIVYPDASADPPMIFSLLFH